ncbi:3'-5' exonuclease [Chromobacterium subtsugae]|uniref:3'-5' exonuclease n=1 Tax=Chromobacterium subtsugae TaxID=251747 RepID=UPI000640DA7F|nr:3'-5' exonuclease [Chromobacterium subtsugae]
MKPILFYDTETTGLPNWSAPSDDPSQPHITQLAAELVDEDTGDVLDSMDMLIQPDGWTIPDDVAALTGITTERAAEFGVPLAQAMDSFLALWAQVERRIGHNEPFDARMIRIELMRLYGDERADEWKAGAAFCTCSNSTKLVNLPPTEKMLAAKRTGPKPPNLGEAFEFFTGRKLEGAHNAMVDVAGCREVYFGILRHREAA